MSAIEDVKRGWRLPADCVPIEFASHAVAQANRRVFRRLDLDFAAHLASALLPDATVSTQRPTWLYNRKRADAWLICEDPRIAFTLLERPDGKFLATTALTDAEGHPVGATVRWVGARG